MRITICIATIPLFLVSAIPVLAQKDYSAELKENLQTSGDVRAIVARAIPRWESENEIKVMPEAASLVAGEFGKNNEIVAEIVRKQKDPEAIWIALAENYLFDVRDRKVRKNIASNAHKRRFGNGLLAVPLQFPEQPFGSPVVEIDVPDINLLPVWQFLKKKVSDWQVDVQQHLAKWPEPLLGVLKVVSRPEGAEFSVETVSGYTCKKVLVTAAEHTVMIKAAGAKGCQKKVSVSPDSGGVASCSAATTCRHWRK